MNFIIRNSKFIHKSLAFELKTPTGDILFRLLRKLTLEWDSGKKYKLALGLCNLNKDTILLEIGFGQGVGLKKALGIMYPDKISLYRDNNKSRGQVIGVDISKYAVRSAKMKNTMAFYREYLKLHRLSVDHLPLLNESVDKVIHIDSFYYWGDLDKALKIIWEKMKPGGDIITVFNPKRVAEARNNNLLIYGRPDFLAYTVSLERNGFNNVIWKRYGDIESITASKPPILRLQESPENDDILEDDNK